MFPTAYQNWSKPHPNGVVLLNEAQAGQRSHGGYHHCTCGMTCVLPRPDSSLLSSGCVYVCIKLAFQAMKLCWAWVALKECSVKPCVSSSNLQLQRRNVEARPAFGTPHTIAAPAGVARRTGK
jgi:hypothetical protein